MTPAVEDAPLVNLREIAEIELFILKRMKEYTVGDHASVFQGSGFNFVGLRDWQPGDRVFGATDGTLAEYVLATPGASFMRRVDIAKFWHETYGAAS